MNLPVYISETETNTTLIIIPIISQIMQSSSHLSTFLWVPHNNRRSATCCSQEARWLCLCLGGLIIVASLPPDKICSVAPATPAPPAWKQHYRAAVPHSGVWWDHSHFVFNCVSRTRGMNNLGRDHECILSSSSSVHTVAWQRAAGWYAQTWPHYANYMMKSHGWLVQILMCFLSEAMYWRVLCNVDTSRQIWLLV